MAVLGCTVVAGLGRVGEEFGFQEIEHLLVQFRGGIEVLETEESLRDVIPAVRIEVQVFDGSLAEVILWDCSYGSTAGTMRTCAAGSRQSGIPVSAKRPRG